MSLPVQYAREVVESMRSGTVANLIAQAKAKQVLRDVHELPANFPQFSSDLDERVTFVAYALLAAGCSLIELREPAEGYAQIQTAADLLESVHRNEAQTDRACGFHCLIGAMAFYAAGQYSRAFVLIRNVESATPLGQLLACFLRKDSQQLLERLNAVLLAPPPALEENDELDDWVMTVALARAVALGFEHTFAGQRELLEAADAILSDAMIVSENSSRPALWWLARLLRLILRDHGSASLWTVVPPFFGPDGLSQVEDYVRLMALSNPPVVELWESQRVAAGVALIQENKGAVINLRTSGGKTRVAELAILQTFKNDPNAKVLYLAPFRSLAFELERVFSKTLTPLGYSVSHLYGGSRFSAVDRDLTIEANITIATPEKAKAMLRAAPDLFDAIKLIVIDEGHLLGANPRNVRNELFLEHLRLLARQRGARMLLLSAVLPNAQELASWVGGSPAALAQSNWKPSGERFGLLRWSGKGVKVEWLGEQRCFNPNFVDFKQVPKGKKNRAFPETKVEAVAATAVRLAALGPVLIFAGQARWVPSMTKNVLLALPDNPPATDWPTTEWKIFESVCAEELGVDCLELEAARAGVVCHSNKLPPQVRIALEKLMAKRAPRIIIATTTLGQGVNIGISSVIVATPFIGAKARISKRDFWNICGRAGRAFVDGEGKILFAIDGTRKPWQIRQDEEMAKEYFDVKQLDTVESGLLLVIRVLRTLALQAGVSFDVLLELLSNNSFDQCGEKKKRVEGVLDIIDDQLLALHVAYKGSDDLLSAPDWVDDAFRESLAAIQEKRRVQQGESEQLFAFLKARAVGVLAKVPQAEARRAVVASGLPLSVALVAFDQLPFFREMVDRYLNADPNTPRLNVLVQEFERWARVSAMSITENMPAEELLDVIRPLWLSGTSISEIVEKCGEECCEICSEFYGYQLPWLFHSVAQKFDKTTEESRVQALAEAGLLVELGLPSEAAAKVFLAGVRSRNAAEELGKYVTDSSASVYRIRNALLDPPTITALSDKISPRALEWLRLLTAERGTAEPTPARCSAFRLDVPPEINVLHARRMGDRVYLCSTDAKFKFNVGVTDQLPFDKLANDCRFVFLRQEQGWHQHCRDPRIPPTIGDEFGIRF